MGLLERRRQGHGEAYRRERNEDDEGGRAGVTTDEEQVLRRG